MPVTWLSVPKSSIVPVAGCSPVNPPRSLAIIPVWLALMFFAPACWAQLDLRQLHQEQLANGLDLLVVEEHSFPSVSVQVLYRSGGRNEPAGQSGIAHFLEHMAFRATENFPDTDVVSQIYAVGGEWHGYTWIDQTTYYATVPSEQLDLLLRIEADRMQRLLIEPRWIEPEKGAVLAEMHGYQNDPEEVLHDALVFAAFQGHPYRNNVIGWESDVRALQHADVLEFYRQHYQAGNAVLVVVGDVNTASVRKRVAELFADFPVSEPTPLPHTLDPPQQGERRIELLGAGAQNYFEIAWRAPAASHPEFAAMLVFQEWLSGGSGINFMQEFGVTAAKPGSALYGRIEGLKSWYPPAAQEYLFSIRGVSPPGSDSEQVEQLVESSIRAMREGEIGEQEIERSRERVLEELVYDLGTHEEAAHELAFYKGLGALDEWLRLPDQVMTVTPDQVKRLAQDWFQPWQRNIGWFRAGEKPSARKSAAMEVNGSKQAANTSEQQLAPTANPASEAYRSLPVQQVMILDNGLPLLVQENRVSDSIFVSLVVAGNQWEGSSYLDANWPAWGFSGLGSNTVPHRLEVTLRQLLDQRMQLNAVTMAEATSDDPAIRLDGMMQNKLGLAQANIDQQNQQQAGLALVVISGKIQDEQMAAIISMLSELENPAPHALTPGVFRAGDERIYWHRELAQAQLAYVVPAPLPNDPDSLGWRALQYLLAHDYEGRLGKEAISNRGLAYYIDSRYQSNGKQAWISLGTGVDPVKLHALEALFREKIGQLLTDPPSDTEMAEARNHLAGRLRTGNQSNIELASELGRQWIWYGRLLTQEEQLAAIRQLDQQDLAAATRGFNHGAYVIIEAGKSTGNVTD